MPEPDSQLPVFDDSRVGKIERIIDSLSDFEQDELRLKLGAKHLRDFCLRMRDPRNTMAIGLHSMVIIGLPLGVLLGTGIGAFIAFKFGLAAGLGAFFGIVAGFSLLLGIIFLVELKVLGMIWSRLANNITGQRSTLLQVQELQIPLSMDASFELCLLIISAKKGVRLKSTDTANGAVSAITSMSWRSPGEIVGVKIDALASDRTRVRVYSKALFTSLDCGKNKANVMQLAKAIEEAADAHAMINSTHG